MGDVHDRQGCVLASNTSPSEVPDVNWLVAEEETGSIIRRIQPTVVSEGRRREVVEYVQRLIKKFLGHEVFPYGSVPLKTYLPDGDIDLTAFGAPHIEDILVGDVRAVLEGEENNKEAEFEVKDVQYINAEVKLVKCLVQNIVVDISFNQIGGLCTLYFLEKVNTFIGKDNLFKRSIILIKAWCYYESRILGAHHALISTYALETLVLHIFHLFHSSLDGPLAVLYKFLDYFSKFDWDNYCVSLQGPVPISYLPQIVVEMPQNDRGELLLTEDFLNECGNLLPYFQRASVSEPHHRVFVKKHLNIVDPLKENNNLGRSVSKGNFHRIRSAFAYGARKLGRILLSNTGNMKDDLDKFFANTLERHGNGDRPDVQGMCPNISRKNPYDINGINNPLMDIHSEKALECKVAAISSSSNGSHGRTNEDLINLESMDSGNTQAEHSTSDNSNFHNSQTSENGEDFVYRKTLSPRAIDASYSHSSVNSEMSKHTYPHSSPPYHEGNGKIAEEDYYRVDSDVYRNGFVCQRIDEIEPSNSRTSHSSTSSQMTSPSTSTNGHTIPGISLSSNDSDGGDDGICDAGHRNIDLNGAADANELANLSGDLAAHANNLRLYAQYSLGNFHTARPVFHGNTAWEHNMLPHSNGVVPMIPPFLFECKFHNTSRGTGTFLPNVHPNQRQFRHRPPSLDRGRNSNSFPNPSHKHRSNGYAVMTPVIRYGEDERGGRRPDALQHSASVANDHSRPSTSESLETPTLASSTPSTAAAPSSQFQIAFGSFGPVPLNGVNPQPSKSTDATVSQNHNSASMYSSVVQKQVNAIQESGSKLAQSYKLRDEEDFPPLAGRGTPPSPVPLNRQKTVWEMKRTSSFS